MKNHIQDDEYYKVNPYLIPSDWPPQWEMDHSRYSYIVVTSVFAKEQQEFLKDYSYTDNYVCKTKRNTLQLWGRLLTREERIDYLDLISQTNNYKSYGEQGFVNRWPLDAGDKIHKHAIDFSRYQYIVLDEEESSELMLTPADGWIKHNWGVVGNNYRELWRKKRRSAKSNYLSKLFQLKEYIGL